VQYPIVENCWILLLPKQVLNKNQNMETPSSLLQTLFAQIKDYGLTTYELTRLKALEAITGIVAILVSKFIVVLVISMFVNYA
jgi:hypothetical protein